MTTPRHEASDSQEPSHPTANRPRHLDIYASDYGDIDNPIPSPPYQRDPSSAHLLLQDHPEHSPAYRSRSNLDLPANMGDQKTIDLTEDEPHSAADTKRKPSVHYTDDVASPPPPNSARPLFTRFESNYTTDGGSGSRTPSLAGTDTEDEDEEFDWSGEEDLVDEEARFEQQMGVKKKKQGWGIIRLITLLFSSLIGSTFLSGVIITPALLVHFFWYKPHPDEHRKYVKDNVEAWLFWAAANVTISWYLAFLIDIVPTLIRFFVSLTWGHVTESIKSKLDLYNSVKDTVKPVFYAASGWVSWVILFESIFKLYNPDDPDSSRASYTVRLFDAVEFLFFFALVICAQKMLSHAIAFSFHRTAYRERLESVTNTLNVIEKLRRYRPKRHAPKSSFGFGRQTPVLSAFTLSAFSDKEQTGGSRRPSPIPSRAGTPDRFGDVISGNEADGEDPDATLVKKKKDKGKQRTSWLAQPAETTEPQSTTSTTRHHDYATSPHAYPPSVVSPRSGAITPSRRGHGSDDEEAAPVVQAATQAAKALKSAVLHDARNIRGKGDDDLGGLVWNVTSSHEAKRLAKAIYMTFRKRNRNYLQPHDFFPAFNNNEDEARAAFRVFDSDNNGDISRAEIKTTLMKVYKERRFLSRSMRDIGMALKTLDHILLFFALVILLFISLSVFDVSVGDSLTSLYSIGIALSFIFKNSASSAFDAIMFLFVTHPFDTGDRCFIDDENLVVKKMGLFATIFTRSDGTETYYFNSLLFTKFIINARRSAKTFENLTMQVAWKTPLEKLDALEQCLNDWLSTEPNRWFEPSTSVTLQKINYQRHLELTIGIGHNGNWQPFSTSLLPFHFNSHFYRDWGLRLARKTAFHAAVQYYCRQLGIIAHEATMPLAWADQDTMDYLPQTPGAYEEEHEHDDTDSLAPPRIPFDGASQQEQHPLVLGFQPPSERHVGVRARKSKSRKAVLRTMGADG